jgi:hypothetical protein
VVKDGVTTKYQNDIDGVIIETEQVTAMFWFLIGCLFYTQLESFTQMELSPFKNCKMLAYAWYPGHLSREKSLSCHNCCDTGPQFIRSQSKDRHIKSPLTISKGFEIVNSMIIFTKNPNCQ